jgi:hypothetical protein
MATGCYLLAFHMATGCYRSALHMTGRGRFRSFQLAVRLVFMGLSSPGGCIGFSTISQPGQVLSPRGPLQQPRKSVIGNHPAVLTWYKDFWAFLANEVGTALKGRPAAGPTRNF